MDKYTTSGQSPRGIHPNTTFGDPCQEQKGNSALCRRYVWLAQQNVQHPSNLCTHSAISNRLLRKKIFQLYLSRLYLLYKG